MIRFFHERGRIFHKNFTIVNFRTILKSSLPLGAEGEILQYWAFHNSRIATRYFLSWNNFGFL